MVRAFKRAMERLVFGMTAEEEDGLSSSLPSKDDPSSNLNHEHSATVVSFKYMPDKKEKRLWDKWRNMASGGASGLGSFMMISEDKKKMLTEDESFGEDINVELDESHAQFYRKYIDVQSSSSSRQRSQSQGGGGHGHSRSLDTPNKMVGVAIDQEAAEAEDDQEADFTICDTFAYQNFQRDNRVDRYLVTIKNWIVPQNMRLDAAERWAAAGSPGTKKNFETAADEIRSTNTTDVLYQLQVTWLLHPTGWDNELIQHDEKRCSSHLDVQSHGQKRDKTEVETVSTKKDKAEVEPTYATNHSTASSKGGGRGISKRIGSLRCAGMSVPNMRSEDMSSVDPE